MTYNPITVINGPDLTSVRIDYPTPPWSKRRHLRATFEDPKLKGYEVLVVADTMPERSGARFDPYGDDRITTMVWRFPRVILPEVNTHRVFSRNSASSRARSVKTTIRAVMDDPYIPLFTINQKGMGGEYADAETRRKATQVILHGRDEAVLTELRLLLGDWLPEDAKAQDWEKYIDWYYANVYDKPEDAEIVPLPEMGSLDAATDKDRAALNIHKQNANRYIEPWMWHEALVTSTYWRNFLRLRIDAAAAPEIHALAVLVREALLHSNPDREWLHLPFIDDIPAEDTPWDELLPTLMSSASECARISYKDRSTASLSDNTKLGARLLEQGHLSPFEHIAFHALSEGVSSHDELKGRDFSSNLSPAWIQLRHVLDDHSK